MTDFTFWVRSSPEWRSYVQLIDGWYRQPISEATGIAADELSSLEQEGGRPLSALMWEWYRLFGAHESLADETCTDYVMPIERVWGASGSLRIYGENQDIWYCCILDADLEQPDPPVYFDSQGIPAEEWEYRPRGGKELVEGHFIPVCDRLSRFLVGLMVRQICLRDEPSPFFRAGVCGSQFIPRFGLESLQPLFGLPDRRTSFLGDDVMLLSDWGFAARTPKALEELAEAARKAGHSFPSLHWMAK